MFRNRPLPSWLQEMAREFISPPQFMRGAQDTTIQPPADHVAPSSADTTRSDAAERGHSSSQTANRINSVLTSTTKNISSQKNTRVAAAVNRRPANTIKSSKRTRASTTTDTIVTTQLHNYGLPSQLEVAYGWQIDGVEQVQGVVRINTPSGSYAVKQTPISGSRVQFIQQALDYASSHGFNRFSVLVSTKKGLPYIVNGRDIYYATKWVTGQTVNFTSTQHVGQLAHALAQFYESTRGFKTDIYQAQDEHNLIQTLSARRQDLRALIRQASQKRYLDEFDDVFLRIGPALQSDADKSLNLLSNDKCTEFLHRSATHSGLCHLDVIPGNFIYDADRRVHLIDFDLSTYAPRVLDLAHLLRRSMQQQYWSSEVAYACFLHYNMVRTMTTEEYMIVQALLTFPYRAWRLAHSRYRVVKDDVQVESLKMYESQERNRQAFLSAYAKHVTKQSEPLSTE